jgi:TPR repeat protein
MKLENAAKQGVPEAIWKLGRMYADGDGVEMNRARAYEYFRRLISAPSALRVTSAPANNSSSAATPAAASVLLPVNSALATSSAPNAPANNSSSAPNARLLADAFVTLGLYHLEGIPGTLKADPNVAREMFRSVAAYFADPEAPYRLGRLYLLGKGAPKDAIQAARLLQLSAIKGDHRAQALLGSTLFKGEQVSRQAALGLFWLIVAKDAAKPDEAWITDMYTSALAQANETERAMAHKYLEDWLKNRRE